MTQIIQIFFTYWQRS